MSRKMYYSVFVSLVTNLSAVMRVNTELPNSLEAAAVLLDV